METFLTALIVLGWGMMVALPNRTTAKVVALMFGAAWGGSKALLFGGSVLVNMALIGPIAALAVFAAWPLARYIGRLLRGAVASGV